MEDFIGEAISKSESTEIQDIVGGLGLRSKTPDEMVLGVAQEMANNSRGTTPELAKKKRGRKPGKSIMKEPSVSVPPPEREIEKPLRDKFCESLNFYKNDSGDKALSKMQKRIMKYFTWQFINGDRLKPYFNAIPPVFAMNMSELRELEERINFFLDNEDDLYYATWAVQCLGGFIEYFGPTVAKRLPFIPGVEILRNQTGLAENLKYLSEVKGQEGLNDELTHLTIKNDGFLPSSPELKILSKLMFILKNNARSNHLALVKETQDKNSGL